MIPAANARNWGEIHQLAGSGASARRRLNRGANFRQVDRAGAQKCANNWGGEEGIEKENRRKLAKIILLTSNLGEALLIGRKAENG